MRSATSSLAALALALLLGGCGIQRTQKDTRGSALGADQAEGEVDGGDVDGGPDEAEDASAELAHTGLLSRRLTAAEIDATLDLVLADTTRPALRLLGEDPRSPFDTDHVHLDESLNADRIGALETFAADVADRLVADPARQAVVLDCIPGATPTAQTDCLGHFTTRLARALLRRTPAANEVQRLVEAATAAIAADGSFDAGVSLVLKVLLQHPEFLYRIERGVAVDGGLRKLTDLEWLSRASFILTGAGPESAWIVAVEGDGVPSLAARRLLLETIWASPRTTTQIDRIHAMWLSYERLPHGASLAQAMRTESRKLLEDVVFTTNEPWTKLFTSSRTWLTSELATHYGMPPPAGGAAWTQYAADSGRAGLLSHGSVLSLGAKAGGETSPTIRGKLVRERLFCQVIPPPPPDANVDEEPQSQDGSPCKIDRYAAHAADGACAGCHKMMDPIGFGLESFDGAGRYRATDSGLAQCPIEGKGEVAGVATFAGPGDLGRVLVEQDIVAGCFAEQLWRYLDSRVEPRQSAGSRLAAAAFKKADYRLKDFLINMLASDAVVLAVPQEGSP